MDNRPAALARTGQQPSCSIEQAGPGRVVGAQADANAPLRVQHVVLVVQGKHHWRGHQTNTSRLANTSLQLIRSTRLSWIFQPPLSWLASL
ncbi:hypothetical protein D3C80_1754990 [compost metagenome]